MTVVTAPLKRAAAKAAISKTKSDASSSSYGKRKKAATSSSVKKTKNPAAKGFRKSRIAAKKTTVRAPTSNINPLNNKAKEAIAEQEMDKVSLGSISVGSSVEEVEVKRKGRPKRTTKESGASLNNTTETSADSEQSVKNPSKKTKTGANSNSKATRINKGGRPKRTDQPPLSPRRSSPGKPPRIVRPFLGGQRLAAIAKETFINNNEAQAIVVEKAVFEVGKERRKRVHWSMDEIEALQSGVLIHGESSWSAILNDLNLSFHPNRTQVDLKDKWRNLTSYKPYNSHPIRRFVLVNTRHQEVLSASGNPHVINNRWPRDAALKLSTKDWIYPVDESGNRADSALIHLKEVLDAEGRSWRPQVVHVYRVTRVLERPKNIPKFNNYRAVWIGKVDKIAEEMLIKADEILSEADEKKRRDVSDSPQSPGSPKSPTKGGNIENFNIEF